MSKSLSDIFSSQFNEMALSRGAAYFENGAVTQVTGDATRVEAEVVGASRYRVALRFDAEDAILTVSCTCTYFTNRFVACKHQWAALLQADKDQLLGAALEASNPTLVESDELEEEGSEPEPPTRRHKRNRSASYGGKPYVPASSWRIPMGQLRDTAQRLDAAAGTRLLYVLDLQPSSEPGRLVLQIAESQRGRNGEWGRARPRRVTYEDMQQLADPADREIFSLLTGSSADAVPFDAETPQAPMRYRLKPEAELALVSRMCATGRCHTKSTFRQETGEALRWEDGDPWRIRLSVTDSTKGSALILVADLVQDLRRLDLGDPDLLVGSTVLVSGGVAAPLHAPGMDGLIDTFRKLGSIEVPKTDEREFIDSLMTLPAGLQIDLPERLELSREHPLPRPQLHLATPKGKRSTTRLEAALEFYYAGHRVKRTDPRSAIFDDARRCILSRNLEAERDAASRLVETGFTARKPSPGGPEYTIAERDLIPAVRTLMGLGWKVTAEGHPFRTPGAFRPSVRSGVDWFELAGSMAFGDEDAPLPLLLRAATTRRQTIQLGDGSIGILPEEWLERFAFLAGLGSRQDDHLRFNQSQTALLDALLRHFPPADTDAVFDAARKRMQDFEGVKAGAAAASFTGVLRHYQEDGLGWLEFLREFGFGGCLADDMGLGKTVQVLALLDAVRARADKPLLPSLVVAPRSVLWNWVREAELFTL